MTPEEHHQLLERIACSLERIEGILTSDNNGLPNQTSPSKQNHAGQINDAFESSDNVIEHHDDKVEAFLNSRGITIKVRKPEDAADNLIDGLSSFLGERYSALRGVLTKIKRSMHAGRGFSEHIAKLSQDDISSVCQFCSRLHAIAFLEDYKYLKSPRYEIHAKTTTLPKAQMFFGGQWLERYTLQKLKEAHAIVQAETEERIELQYLINPQIILPNGDDFELDLIAVVGDSPIWIEAKSGDYQQHVQKYSRLAGQLGLDYSHAMMVLTDVSDDRCEALSSLFSMSVTNLNTLESQIVATLRGHQNNQPNRVARGINSPRSHTTATGRTGPYHGGSEGSVTGD